MSVKKILIDWLPPAVLRWLTTSKTEGWFGNYPTWQDALAETTGYNDSEILEKVKNAVLQVKNGNAVFERDSVIFEEVEYSWPMLAGIMWIAAQNKNSINLIDFGGSLGSSYFQNRKFLQSLDQLSWNIIEQENFITAGKAEIETDQLKFYYNIDECLEATRSIDVLLFSSVLQYIDKPYELIDNILKYKFPYIFIDRTSFNLEPKDRLTIQKVPERIYKASYPCWFFHKEKLFSSFKGYELVEEFDSLDNANIPSFFKGAIFKLKTV